MLPPEAESPAAEGQVHPFADERQYSPTTGSQAAMKGGRTEPTPPSEGPARVLPLVNKFLTIGRFSLFRLLRFSRVHHRSDPPNAASGKGLWLKYFFQEANFRRVVAVYSQTGICHRANPDIM